MYLGLLHTAATTGQMPVLSPKGQRTEQSDPLTPQERMKLLQYLVDKCMGAAAPTTTEAAPVNTDVLRSLTPDQLRGLTLDELRSLMAPPAPASARAMEIIDV
jgi:hypothetical protein